MTDSHDLRPVLQSRWKLVSDEGRDVLVYFGLRNYGGHRRQAIPVSPAAASALRRLDGCVALSELGPEPAHELAPLIEEGILVAPSARRPPATEATRRRCVRCVNDDLILPGLEFDGRGVCAFCQCFERAPGMNALTANSVSEDDLRAAAANRAAGSRFDVMVLYTGGKDSSFLLWFLAKKLGLRVLAAFWNMPYTNDSARDNIRRAMARLTNVEFVERTVAWDAIRQAMAGQFRRVGMPCLCPTVAFALFYPLAAQEHIPLVLTGIEEVQLAIMEYVFPVAAPAAAPLTPRQQTLAFLKFRALPAPIHTPLAYHQEWTNYHASIREQLAPLYDPLLETLRRADAEPDVAIPLIKRLRTNESYGRWSDVVALLGRELDWRMPAGQRGMLHTSCRIETVKDYTQYMRFRNMRTTFFPQSIVELSASVFFGLMDRAEALEHLAELGYLRPPPPLAPLLADLGITEQDVAASNDELAGALR
jgi:hypothetical protein